MSPSVCILSRRRVIFIGFFFIFFIVKKYVTLSHLPSLAVFSIVSKRAGSIPPLLLRPIATVTTSLLDASPNGIACRDFNKVLNEAMDAARALNPHENGQDGSTQDHRLRSAFEQVFHRFCRSCPLSPDTSIARVSKPAAKNPVVPKPSLKKTSARAALGQVDKSASNRKATAVESTVVSQSSQAKLYLRFHHSSHFIRLKFHE